MLLDLIRSGFDRYALVQIMLLIPVILISLSVHEYAHGYTAMKLGDNTALSFGRLTLNPAKHIDPIGFLFLLLFGFGWAKPVPVNLRNVKKGRFGFLAVSLAGPLSNVLLAFIGALLLELFVVIQSYVSVNVIVSMMIFYFFSLFIQLNAGYAVFNLIPIPPLDGSRILTAIIPRKFAELVFRYERYIQIVVLILLFSDALNGIISAGIGYVTGFVYKAVGLIPFELLMKG